MPSTFKLDITGRYVIEDDGSPHPTIWTRAEAGERMGRLETQAAAYEREADEFHAQGRLWDAGYARDYCRVHLTIATDLLSILQGVQHMARAA